VILLRNRSRLCWEKFQLTLPLFLRPQTRPLSFFLLMFSLSRSARSAAETTPHAAPLSCLRISPVFVLSLFSNLIPPFLLFPLLSEMLMRSDFERSLQRPRWSFIFCQPFLDDSYLRTPDRPSYPNDAWSTCAVLLSPVLVPSSPDFFLFLPVVLGEFIAPPFPLGLQRVTVFVVIRRLSANSDDRPTKVCTLSLLNP